MSLHELPIERRTLHGHFSPGLAPVLEIESGDEVVFQTLDARWSVGGDWRRFEPMDPELDTGHALCGPVLIEGAQPGMTLAIEVLELVTEASKIANLIGYVQIDRAQRYHWGGDHLYGVLSKAGIDGLETARVTKDEDIWQALKTIFSPAPEEVLSA